MALQTKFGNSLPHWKKTGKRKQKNPTDCVCGREKKALEAVNGNEKSIPP